ncbi:alcohol dehydrogenase catalytic domain-containing protein [Catellatospora coxensis]
MHAIRQYEFGPAENLRFEEVPDPVPGEGQVLIEVEAAGVHLIDTTIRSGGPGPLPPPALPMTPGREVAGRVAGTGPGVDPAWQGRRVVAYLGMTSGGTPRARSPPSPPCTRSPSGCPPPPPWR